MFEGCRRLGSAAHCQTQRADTLTRLIARSSSFLRLPSHGHVKENIWQGIPQGWLARNHQAWFNSNQRLLMMEKLQKAKIIPGHDEDIAKPLFGKVLT